MRKGAAAVVATLVGAGASAEAPPIFVDVAKEAGIDFVYFNGMSGAYYMPEMVGGGGALFDYDNDGDLDVYLVQGSLLVKDSSSKGSTAAETGELGDRLFRNELISETGSGVLRFTDVSEEAGLGAGGYGLGIATADFDNDGWRDVYVTGFGSNRLLRNRGNGSFENVTEASGTNDSRWSVPALFFDYDRDGWLDLFVGNYVDYSLESSKTCRSLSGVPDYCGPLSYEAASDRLLRNRGDGTFEEVTAKAGLLAARGGALGAVAGDFDSDGWPDLYVANDGLPNQMWINQGDGKFLDEALLAGTSVNMMGRPEASMGVALGDFDDDGDEDLFLTHLRAETNTLYRNGGDGFFEDATTATGLGAASWTFTAFGTAFVDYDNDGLLDLFVANGAVHVPDGPVEEGRVFPLDERNQLFRNLGGGRFADVSASVGPVMSLSEVSRAVVPGDIDNDGDADLLVINNSGPTRLLLNQIGSQKQWIGVRAVEGDPPRDSLGARVGVRLASGAMRWRWIRTAGSYAASADPRALIGLGDVERVDEVVVVWPDGTGERWPATLGRYTTLLRRTGEAWRESR